MRQVRVAIRYARPPSRAAAANSLRAATSHRAEAAIDQTVRPMTRRDVHGGLQCGRPGSSKRSAASPQLWAWSLAVSRCRPTPFHFLLLQWNFPSWPNSPLRATLAITVPCTSWTTPVAGPADYARSPVGPCSGRETAREAREEDRRARCTGDPGSWAKLRLLDRLGAAGGAVDISAANHLRQRSQSETSPPNVRGAKGFHTRPSRSRAPLKRGVHPHQIVDADPETGSEA